jgi:hypothetical protein
MQFLFSQGCDCVVHDVCIQAALSGSVDVLACVFEQLERDEVVMESTLLTDMLNAAGGVDELNAAKWLRQRGAEWPPVLCFVKEDASGDEGIRVAL